MGENRIMHDLYEENQRLKARIIVDLYKENKRLKARIEELEEKHWNECGQIAHYSDELRRTKELLKKAVEDFNTLGIELDSNCELCGFRLGCEECPLHRAGINCRCWNHQDEALALIGEDTNVPASADDTNVGHKSGDWISCKDRMPEVNEPVLFIFNTESGFKAVMYGWHETIKGLGSGWHQAGVGGARADEEVTYWQPLPEPPKDGEQNENN